MNVHNNQVRGTARRESYGNLQGKNQERMPTLQGAKWYNAPFDAQGLPIRYDWSLTSLRNYVTECVQALDGHTNCDYNVHSIKIPAKYWRGPIGFSRLKTISLVERGFVEQFAYRDHYKLGVWMSRTLEDRQGRLKGKIVPPPASPWAVTCQLRRAITLWNCKVIP